MKKTKIIALIGEAGSGKDYILQKALETYPQLHEIISCTTRPIREGEREGVNYYFLSLKDFIDGMNDGQFLETACFNGWFYGTHLDSVNPNRPNIGVFNPQGIRSLIHREDIDLYVFYVCASKKERLIRQLSREDNPNVDEIIRRYSTDEKDFKNLDFDYFVLPNSSNSADINIALEQIRIKAELG